MATETAFRPHIDQENAQAVNIKGGNVSGKRLLSDKHLDVIFQPFICSGEVSLCCAERDEIVGCRFIFTGMNLV